jgi:capsular polysaccharide transport system permease protein
MIRVIYALILRETHNRYGNLKIGYLWALIEPMLFVVILSIVFSYIQQRNSGPMPPTLFYVTGILPYFLFLHVFTTTMTAVKQNFQLLTFPQVQLIDLVTARAILELASSIIVFSIFVSVISLVELETVSIDYYSGLFQSVILLFLLGFGAGIMVSALIPISPSIQIIATILIRPLFFLSGIFFTVDFMPAEARNIILWNPVLHLIELFRSAFFKEFESASINMEYVTAFTLSLLFLGLLLQRAFRRYAMRMP